MKSAFRLLDSQRPHPHLPSSARLARLRPQAELGSEHCDSMPAGLDRAAQESAHHTEPCRPSGASLGPGSWGCRQVAPGRKPASTWSTHRSANPTQALAIFCWERAGNFRNAHFLKKSLEIRVLFLDWISFDIYLINQNINWSFKIFCLKRLIPIQLASDNQPKDDVT